MCQQLLKQLEGSEKLRGQGQVESGAAGGVRGSRGSQGQLGEPGAAGGVRGSWRSRWQLGASEAAGVRGDLPWHLRAFYREPPETSLVSDDLLGGYQIVPGPPSPIPVSGIPGRKSLLKRPLHSTSHDSAKEGPPSWHVLLLRVECAWLQVVCRPTYLSPASGRTESQIRGPTAT